MRRSRLVAITSNMGSERGENFYRVNTCWMDNFTSIFAKYDISVVFIPHRMEFVDNYFNNFDGLIISGNAKHVPPKLYGQERDCHIAEDEICCARSPFELEMARRFIDADKPLLGICGGMQIINVAMGGSLVQHIPSYFNSDICHSQEFYQRRQPAHRVMVEGDSFLHTILTNDAFYVNSFHVQCVKDVGQGVSVSAKSSDGVVEAIEMRSKKFCVGVQWHPEFNVSKQDEEIFEAFARSVFIS